MGKTKYSIGSGLLLLAAVTLGLGLAAERSRQPLNIVVTSFRVVPDGFYPEPHQTQPKSLLEGVKAQPQPNDRYLVTDAKWTFYHTNGQRSMEFAATQCTYDSKEKSASSPGPLSVQTADGQFALTGEGFHWRPIQETNSVPGREKQTNSVLHISNRVHTVVHRSLLQDATNRSETVVTGGDLQAVDIDSDRFEYATATGLGIYDGHVRVAGTNLIMAAGRLTIRMPIQERRLHQVLAEQDVEVDYAQVHATGQRADYSVDTDVLQVTGQPAWKAEAVEGRADALTIQRTNQLFQAMGNTWLKIPSHGFGNSNLLSSLGPQTLSNAPPAKASNQWVEVRSDRYERRPGSAVFDGGVKVEEREGQQVRGALDCQTLRLTFVGTNELRQMVAEKAVNIRQGDRGFRSGKAVFTPTNGLELTESPSWRDGLREGKGDWILLQREQMRVRGHASIRLPASQVAASSFLAQPAPTNSVKSNASTSNQWASVESDEYLLTPQTARFEGKVRMTHPQMRWQCETVVVDFASEGGRADRLVAEPAVEFDLINEDGQTMHGTGAKAVYTYKATPAKTNEVVHLTGSPALLAMTNVFKFKNGLTTNTFNCRNDVIILDLATFSLQTPGRYGFHGLADTGETNKFQLPSNRWPK